MDLRRQRLRRRRSPKPVWPPRNNRGDTPASIVEVLAIGPETLSVPSQVLNWPRRRLGKPVKQVKIAEDLQLEAGGTPNEVLMVQAVPPSTSTSLADALAFHQQPKEVNVLNLSSEKRLVGALDTACNRTCTGPSWLSSFLAGLKSAPQWIQSLAVKSPEHEVFRFGNGGTQVSSERWRLPMLVEERSYVFGLLWCKFLQGNFCLEETT